MRFLSAFLVALVLSLTVKAAPGDTTWVAANNVQLDYYNNFDTMVKFPDGSTKYRKIIMIFNLGKYICPGTPSYCSDWDYTVQTYAMNKVGDTVELGRLITPYGKGARMGSSAAWNQNFYFDVTDYTTVLKDSNKIRIHYSGYSGGFTANIKFAMIEGTPERDVKGVKAMWDGSFSFGDAANPIDSRVAAKSLTAPAGTQSATYRLNITGHGSDATGCSEFCSKYYQVLKDGSVVDSKNIWRDNCGLNNLYPQSGTWIYDRGNWCPGDLIHTNFHPLPGVSAGSTFNLSMAFEPYVTASPSAVYTVFGSVVYYGGVNKILDASLDDIIAPTNYEGHFRDNARIGYTTVKIRNTGSTMINNIELEYGVSGQPLTKTFWTGNIPSLTDTIIDLPFASSLISASGTNQPYEVNILNVNRVKDNDASNDKMTTTFNAAPQWPATFAIYFSTNHAVSSGVSETEWRITDGTGALVASRINNAADTYYRDTITLPTGIYKLSVTDVGCDGLGFWANPSAGSGSMQVKPTLFTTLTLAGYFGGDFGCGFTQYFRVGTPTSIHDVNIASDAILSVYPNPAKNNVTVLVEDVQAIKGTLTIADNMGRVVYTQFIQQSENNINTEVFSNGLYFVSYQPAAADSPKKLSKLVIVK